MAPEPGSAREAAERNARAVMEGKADITPAALTQMMQLGANAAALAPTTMPSITGYSVEEVAGDGESELFNVTFHSTVGWATLSARWQQVMGQWKITEVGVVSFERSEGGA
jgi:hypothetical protein